MKERFRDKTRDDLAAALQSLGLPASMSERDVPIENVQKPGWARALGGIEIAEGPIPWINVFKRDGNQYSATRWWYVFLVPDDRPIAEDRFVSIKSATKKSFPLIGFKIGMSWGGEDYDTGLLTTLSDDLNVRQLVLKRNDLEIKRHDKSDFDGWAIIIEKRFAPSHEEWRVIQQIAEYLLESGSS